MKMTCSAGRAIKIGYIGSETGSRWAGRYSRLDGEMRRSLRPKGKLLTINVLTNSGSLSAEVYNKSGELILSEENIGTKSLTAAIFDKVTVRLIAKAHCGSFEIT